VTAEPRGPYKSAISGMTPEQAARWFAAQGKAAWETRSSNYGAGDAPYVNAKFRCSRYADQAGQARPKGKPREWYCQGQFPGNAWRM
jgi:hypothetical protein